MQRTCKSFRQIPTCLEQVQNNRPRHGGDIFLEEFIVEHSFSRIEMILGREAMERLKNSKVAVFGIGGVGSFTVEALARAGIGNMVLVDYDRICITNINRQIHAVVDTVGKPKVEVMKERILHINPGAKVDIFRTLFNKDTSGELIKEDYDYVIDAIDMVSSKIELIAACKSKNIPVISSMGTGNKLEPTLLRIGDIYETSVCPLARVMRRELRKRNIESLKVVYSTEKPVKPLYGEEYMTAGKKRINGSTSFVPSAAGIILAGEVVRELAGYSR